MVVKPELVRYVKEYVEKKGYKLEIRVGKGAPEIFPEKKIFVLYPEATLQELKELVPILRRERLRWRDYVDEL